MALPRASRIVAILAALLASQPAHAAEDVIDLATETSCNRLLAEAVRLTEAAYRHEGETPEQAAQETRAMLADAFFFWPADYFLLDPGNVDAAFTALRARMLALAARSGALHCGIGFHPVPES